MIGWLAMAAHGFDRATRDLDPAVDSTSDIVSRLGDAFQFEDLELERVRAGAATITVVSPRTLYRMKRDTVRLRDRDDAQRLARAFGFDQQERR